MFSVGLNGSPFTPEFAIVKWTDSSNTALPALKYIGFTAGNVTTVTQIRKVRGSSKLFMHKVCIVGGMTYTKQRGTISLLHTPKNYLC